MESHLKSSWQSLQIYFENLTVSTYFNSLTTPRVGGEKKKWAPAPAHCSTAEGERKLARLAFCGGARPSRRPDALQTSRLPLRPILPRPANMSLLVLAPRHRLLLCWTSGQVSPQGGRGPFKSPLSRLSLCPLAGSPVVFSKLDVWGLPLLDVGLQRFSVCQALS